MATKLTLVVMAAGMATRYGSLKQLEQFGPNGETIIDYSVYDAVKAGFGQVVFVIRESLIASFKETLLPRFAGKIAVDYVLLLALLYDGLHPSPGYFAPSRLYNIWLFVIRADCRIPFVCNLLQCRF